MSEDYGKIYTVQYFERARFEYHPEEKDPNYQVQLGLLTAYLTQVKDKFPAKTDATLLLEPDISYQLLVAIMDRVRVAESCVVRSATELHAAIADLLSDRLERQ